MLSEKFDRKRNSLNAIRLLMAIGVIFWHSFPITGQKVDFAPLHQLLGEIWVDGFFAISGFLITGAWLARPRVRLYLVNRGLRILPAFYVCLVVTAFIFAPLGVWIQGGDWRRVYYEGTLDYIVSNLGVWMFQFDVAGTPTGVPYPGTWNGSLWTLGWELLCYIAILALGVIGLLRRAYTLPLAFGAAWLGVLASVITDVPWFISDGSRFAVMFLAGALVLQFKHRIPCNWKLVGVAAVFTVGSMWLPDYRLIGALAWTYVVLSVGALAWHRSIEFKTWDISYGVYIYAFPIQQLLVITAERLGFGVSAMNPIAFSVLATAVTIPAALLCRWAVEIPSERQKPRLAGRDLRRKRRRAPAGQTAS